MLLDGSGHRKLLLHRGSSENSRPRSNEPTRNGVPQACASCRARWVSLVLSEADPGEVLPRFPMLSQASLRLLQTGLSDTRKEILPRNVRESLRDRERVTKAGAPHRTQSPARRPATYAQSLSPRLSDHATI